ncbi:MAG TPA: STAS domain-containing protein [Terracidiphilus sp.]|jgi:ABC-type transporter Mla MlaB component
MSVTLSQGENASRVLLEGCIDIADAGELNAALLQALGSGKTVEVALENLTGLDVTAVQLLWAAQREAQRKSIAIRFAGTVPAQVLDALADMGLTEFLSCAQNR